VRCAPRTTPFAQRIAILFLLLACAYVARAAAPPLPAADPQRYVDDIKALAAPRWKVAAPAQKASPAPSA